MKVDEMAQPKNGPSVSLFQKCSEARSNHHFLSFAVCSKQNIDGLTTWIVALRKFVGTT